MNKRFLWARPFNESLKQMNKTLLKQVFLLNQKQSQCQIHEQMTLMSQSI